MQLVIISGRSGSGKTIALHVLEDIGFYCVDNLPISLLPKLVNEIQTYSPTIKNIAVGIDARNNPKQLENFPQILKQLKQVITESKVIYLDSTTKELIKRFSETRRKHPISSNNISLPEAIESENELLGPISSSADISIDTSRLSLHDLRDLIKKLINYDEGGMAVLIESFGFKHGIPSDADLVFDVRCLPNPHWVPNLRAKTGLDQEVKGFLSQHKPVKKMLKDIINYLEDWLPEFAENNRSYMTVAIGCTGGQHRSIYMTECIYEHFKPSITNLQSRHRDIKAID